MNNSQYVFTAYGKSNKRGNLNWRKDMDIINLWKDGQTGMPLIDSFMRELNSTGYLSRFAIFAASRYLTLYLKQDWRYGAFYFQQ